MRSALGLLFVVAMCATIGTAPSLLAQPPSLVVQFPRDGLVDVSNQPVITVTCADSLLPESISFGYPDHTVGGLSVPTVTLVEDQGPGTPLHGRYALVDHHTLTFRPYHLAANTTYRVTVSGVMAYVARPIAGPVVLPEVTWRFTTAAEIPRYLSTTLDKAPYLGCKEPIDIHFSGDVARGWEHPERLVRVYDVTNQAFSAPISCPVEVRGSSMRLLPPDGGWPPGALVNLVVDPSSHTGDPLDRHEILSQVRSAGRLDFSVIEKDGDTLPDDLIAMYDSLDRTITAGNYSLATLLAPLEYQRGLYRFVGWKTPVENLNLETHTDVTISCDLLLAKIPITAIVDKIDSISMTIVAGDGGVVEIYDQADNLRARVTDTLVLGFGPETASMRLVARPDSSYRFAAWSAPSSILHASPSPAIVVNLPLAQHLQAVQAATGRNTVLTPGFTPNVNPNNPTNSPIGEQYRLVASITTPNPEPGYDHHDGAFFTTRREFEDVKTRTEEVCIQAQPCWQIIGYTITASGTTVWIDPANDLCVTAPLTSPENAIIFYIERKPILLRMEHIVMNTDDPNTRIIGRRPRSGEYVEVSRRVKSVTGTDHWERLVSTVCEDNQRVAYNLYEFRCGDAVRFTCRTFTQRQLLWRFFQDLPGYVIPTLVSSNETVSVYQLVVDEPLALFIGTTCAGNPLQEREIRLRACFRQDFGIEAIGMTVRVRNGSDRSKATWEFRYRAPEQLREREEDEPFGGRHMEYIPNFGAEIKVVFTQPVDVRTLYNRGAMVSSRGNILPNDPSMTPLDHTFYTYNDEHVSFEPLDGRLPTTLVFRLCDPQTSPRQQTLYGGDNILRLFSSITSLDGIPLRTDANILLSSMELPPLFVEWDQVRFDYDGDPDFLFLENAGETYHVLYGANIAKDGFHNVRSTVKRIPICDEQQGIPPNECTIPYSDKGPAYSFGNRVVFAEPNWMDHADVPWLNVVSYDEDCKDVDDCLINRLPMVLDDLEQRIEKYQQPYTGGNISSEQLVMELLGVGVTALRTILTPDEEDQHLGEATFLEGRSTMWGTKTATAPYVTIRHSNATYRFRSRFLPMKAVVR